MRTRAAGIVLALMLAATAAAQQSYAGAAQIDAAIQGAVDAGEIPGAVVRIGGAGGPLYTKAYGSRALVPAREPMTVDTIFDIASLTKVVATTTAMMRLFEDGKVRLTDPVTRYLPGFQNGRSDINVRHLLTHFSGMRPDLDITPAWTGYELGITKALGDKPVASPGERFQYSDINFILLGEMVRQLSGKRIDEYSREVVFGPLEMRDSGYLPAASLRTRIAPTEVDDATGRPFRGVVHDPTTRYMDGVAGHAGVFATAEDLSHFAEMLLNEGMYRGRRLFSAATIAKFTEPASPPSQPILRGLGWDIESPYSSNRGELFPIGSFGHTGFTGTSIWIDPRSKTYVILLTNSVHPKRGRSINSLRSRVATIAAAQAGIAAHGVLLSGYNETMTGVPRVVERNGEVLTGLDVLSAEGFARLKSKRVGLITNHTGLSREGKRNIDLMRAAGVELVALFSPEHGLTGQRDDSNIASARDAATGLQVYSLYEGENRRPNERMLSGVDVLVFDIQDAGVRFYTYMCTMLYALEEASRRGIGFVVLDRPNPITGVHVEGPMLDNDLQSFVGCYSLPVRHGMTLGEIAAMANGEKKWGAKLDVVKMQGWERGDWFDETGLGWVNPSPNLRSLNAEVLYPALALLEYSTGYSVGRGTDSPFEQIGAAWIRGRELAAYLNSRRIPGVRVYPTSFSTGTGTNLVEGVRFVITGREEYSSTRLGLEIAAALVKLYPGRIAVEANRRLIGSAELIRMIGSGGDARVLTEGTADGLREFLKSRSAYLMY